MDKMLKVGVLGAAYLNDKQHYPAMALLSDVAMIAVQPSSNHLGEFLNHMSSGFRESISLDRVLYSIYSAMKGSSVVDNDTLVSAVQHDNIDSLAECFMQLDLISGLEAADNIITDFKNILPNGIKMAMKIVQQKGGDMVKVSSHTDDQNRNNMSLDPVSEGTKLFNSITHRHVEVNTSKS